MIWTKDEVFFLVPTLLLALAAPAPVYAQGRDDEARALYAVGEVAFSEGLYESALAHFQQAYALSPRPILLFNIGASAERLRRDALALEAYEQYVEELPDAPNRGAVALRIVFLRQALYDEPAPATDRTSDVGTDTEVESRSHTNTDSPSDADERSGTVTPWIMVGMGASAVVLGAVFTGLGYADAATVRDLPDGTPWANVEDEYERAPRRQIAGFAALGVGTLAVITGVVLAVTSKRDSPSGHTRDSARVSGWVDRSSAGVVASGSF